ncbi:MAG TPA: hypothetical protein VMT18_08615 [Planctomycetota bacterium]|nr:hypothetical protein [Planctomycetota bacterium]
MTPATLRPRSLVLGFALGSIATLALAFAAPRAAGPADMEHKIVVDIESKDIDEMAKDGWEYAGYLGVSVRGENADETLWRRPRK